MMDPDLTVLCVTEERPHARPFLAEFREIAVSIGARVLIYSARKVGVIENVLDRAVAMCPDGYVLRLDDDELPTPDMFAWLQSGGYREARSLGVPAAASVARRRSLHREPAAVPGPTDPAEREGEGGRP